MLQSYVKRISLGIVLLSAQSSFADRLINVPTARPLSPNSIKIEYLGSSNTTDASEQFLAFVTASGIEFELRNRKRLDETGHSTFDVGYVLIGPVASTSPGISVGFLDVLNETLDGRRSYLALTFRELLEVGDLGENGDFTIGVQGGSINSAFVGISLPFSGRTRMVVEHNGARLTAGLESTLVPGLTARVFAQDKLLLAGVSFSRKF